MNFDVFKSKLVCIPVHADGTHWYLVVVDVVKKEIKAYDSLRNKKGDIIKSRMPMLEHVFHFLQDEFDNDRVVTNGHQRPERAGWTLIDSQVDTPTQFNEFDCGLIVCISAFLLSLGYPVDFNSEDITRFGRLFVGLSILNFKFG